MALFYHVINIPQLSSVFSSISTLADCVDMASAETASDAVLATEEGVAQCEGEGSRGSPVFSDSEGWDARNISCSSGIYMLWDAPRLYILAL